MKPAIKLPSFFNNQYLRVLLVMLVFLPLMFLNIRNDHDWGDDFAQYLSQAENIANLQPMNQTGYVYNEFYPSLGPKAYPPGFPLMIAPMVKRFGNYIPPYNYLISTFLLLTTLLTVVFLKRSLGLIPALALSLMVFYNPYVVELKAELMSDIPFAFLVVLFLFVTSGKAKPLSLNTHIIAGVIAGLAISVKTAGFTLPAAMAMLVVWQLFTIYRKKEKPATCWQLSKGPLLSIATALLLYFILNRIFMRGASGTSSYLNTFSFTSLSQTIAMNIYTYTEVLRKFFIDIDSGIFWFGFIAGSAATTFTITGLIIAFRRGPTLLEWIMLAYFGLLIVYPYHNSGFRFLLPLAPLILYYIATAVVALRPGKGGIVLSAAVCIMMLLTYLPALHEIEESTDEIREGPFTGYSQNAFDNVRLLTADDALIVFIKPRVVARFTGRNSMAHLPESSPLEVYNQFKEKRPTHFLLYSELPDPALENYLLTNRDETELIWQNSFFRLYRKYH